MPPKSKSLFRGPNVKKYEVVYRSHRDPLIHDEEEGGERVLKEVQSYNVIKKGTTKDDLERVLPSKEVSKIRTNEGEAAEYGIYFDDTEYDYMQHFKSAEELQDAVFIEAPTRDKKGKGKEKLQFRDEDDEAGNGGIQLPASVLPSDKERSYQEMLAEASEDLYKFNPDLDPDLREVLEALDDEAYIMDEGYERLYDEDDSGETSTGHEEEDDADADAEEEVEDADDFFRDLVKDGERKDGDRVEWKEGEDGGFGGDSSEWAAEMARIKIIAAQAKAKARAEAGITEEDEDYEGSSDGEDTIGDLPSGLGRKGRGVGPGSVGTGFSMSSSSMFRNEGLRTLDERFEKLEKEYEREFDPDFDSPEEDNLEMNDDIERSGQIRFKGFDPDSLSDEDDEEEPEEFEDDEDGGDSLVPTNRSDFNDILDEFLEKYEVIGGKLKPSLEGGDAAEKFGTLRKELAALRLDKPTADPDGEITEEEKQKLKKRMRKLQREKDEMVEYEEEADPRDKWDCETILSTYSNLSNHPRMLRIRESVRKPKDGIQQISIDPKTGFPLVNGRSTAPGQKRRHLSSVDESKEEGDVVGESRRKLRETVARSRDETPEERKARKEQVKAERQARRVEKKTTKETFGKEKKRQTKMASSRLADGGAADVAALATAGKATVTRLS